MMNTKVSDHYLRQPPSPNDAVNWVILAKQVLHDKPDKLNTLYKTVFAFRDRQIDTPTLVNTIAQLLHGHTNLLKSINTFLPETYTVGTETEDVGTETEDVGTGDYSCLSKGIEFVNKIHRRFGKDREVFSAFLNIMKEHKDDSAGVFEKVSVLFREFPELIRDFTAFLPDEPECGPSYRRKMTEEPVSMYRTEKELTVLNDDWICSAGSFTDSERPQAVSEWEDDRYEIDVLIERGKTAIKHIDDILTGRTDDILTGRTDDKQLPAMDQRFIEMLYGEQGLTMVDQVKKDPRKSLPIVKARVEQRVVQLTVFRQEMNREPARVYRTNGPDPMQRDDNSDH